MGTTCPFCHYTRQPTDDAPAWQCPNCQKVYAKGANPTRGSIKPIERVPSSPKSVYVLFVGIFASMWFVKSLKPTSVMAFILFSGWLSLPYVIAYFIQRGAKDRSHHASDFIVSLILVIEGVALLIDIIYLHPDAQGGIAVVMVPILQVASLPLMILLCRWLSNKLNCS